MGIDELEPLLEAGEIQGNILGGFNKPHQAMLPLYIGDTAAARGWIADLMPDLTFLPEVIGFRAALKQHVALTGAKPAALNKIWTNIAFSFPCISKLAQDAGQFEPVFKAGLFARSAALGDPTDAASPGNMMNWLFGGPNAVPDMLVIIAADQDEDLQARVASVLASAASRQIRWPHHDIGHDTSFFPQAGLGRGHEHFGFKDGISQPGVRGRLGANPDVFITARPLPPDLDTAPSTPVFSAPGQPLIFPGEFVLGYARQNETFPRLPKEPARLGSDPTRITTQSVGPKWARNGSFLVYRRLRQNVPAFNRFLQRQTAALGQLPGFAGLQRDRLGALLVGRWPSGAPLLRAAAADNPALGADDGPNNDFSYADAGSASGAVPAAAADPQGLVCPAMAHIRKVNPRGMNTDLGGPNRTLLRRILRRGIPYGPPLPLGTTDDPDNTDRGLLFVSYQVSIRDQFEFLQTNWTNNESNPTAQLTPESGFDIIMGQNAVGARSRFCVLGGTRIATDPVLDPEWVVATGGGYFFSPSKSALQEQFAQAAVA
jgi:Dyp-type peroxidase family